MTAAPSADTQFVILGNTSIRGLPQREHALAREIARRGYRVLYIEGMPSLAGSIKEALIAQNAHGPDPISIHNDRLQVLTPPMVPTFFRSSWTPALDRFLFRRWFEMVTAHMRWDSIILYYMFPLWGDGFVSPHTLRPKRIVYDLCDALEFPSRNQRALRRMIHAQASLAEKVELVTYSAREMEQPLASQFPNAARLFLPNAVAEEFLTPPLPKRNANNRHVLGYAGGFDRRRIDATLLHAVAEKFSHCDLVIVGPAERSLQRELHRYQNVHFTGSIPPYRLREMISRFDVGLIPFARNTITEVINPLKLYDYCMAGVPVVATATRELCHYDGLIYLASGIDEFCAAVQRAMEEPPEFATVRKQFASENTWRQRVDALLACLV